MIVIKTLARDDLDRMLEPPTVKLYVRFLEFQQYGHNSVKTNN